ncbi:MAG: four helix bundle protein [Candidatus Parcubacteria bacterium]|nr:four helix bundle protein [Candidatus Parcubacteria bacterium]
MPFGLRGSAREDERIISIKFLMNQTTNSQNKEYDLEERTTKFSINLINFLKTIRRDDINKNVIIQLVRAATPIGANYCESNASSSKKDFRNKIYICKKEANETKYWLRILAECHSDLKDKIKIFWREAHELHLIFQKITSTINKNV